MRPDDDDWQVQYNLITEFIHWCWLRHSSTSIDTRRNTHTDERLGHFLYGNVSLWEILPVSYTRAREIKSVWICLPVIDCTSGQLFFTACLPLLNILNIQYHIILFLFIKLDPVGVDGMKYCTPNFTNSFIHNYYFVFCSYQGYYIKTIKIRYLKYNNWNKI